MGRIARRTVAFPSEMVDELCWHLGRFVEPGGDGGLVFVGPLGRSFSRAALIYQRASRSRDEAIAAALGNSPLGRSGERVLADQVARSCWSALSVDRELL